MAASGIGEIGEDGGARTRAGARALDGLVFFSADIQTGFGPFVAVYLAAQGWTQTDIGLTLSAAGVATVLTQVPAGAVIDATRQRAALAVLALIVLALSALALAFRPSFAVVVAARSLQAAAAGLLSIAIAALSLDLVGRSRMAARFGRNASISALGTIAISVAMGALGYFASNGAALALVAASAAPAIVSLAALGRIEGPRSGRVAPRQPVRTILPGLGALARDRAFVVFAGCGTLFMASYISMLILAAGLVAQASEHVASAMVAGSVVVQQLVIAAVAAPVGRFARRWGRKPLLVLGLAAVPVRGVLFALTLDPRLVVLFQALDGVAIGTLSVLVPIITADIAARTGHFNLAQGVVGMAVGVGGIVGPVSVGLLADGFGARAAFLAMTVVSAATVAVIGLGMPETARPAGGTA